MSTAPVTPAQHPGQTLSTAVVICTHLEERLDQLVEAVGSIRGQSRQPDELVVVVDGGRSLHDLVAARLPGLPLLLNPQSGGLSGARNEGVAATTSDVVLFLDDDAVADPHWLAHLVAVLEEDERVLGSSGRSLPLWGGVPPAWLTEEFWWTVGCSYRGQPVVRSYVRNAYGGCCALRRALFTELGGYDVRLGKSPWWRGGGEEAELSLRAMARWQGSTFAFEPAAVIEHRVPVARLTFAYVIGRAYAEGRSKARVSRLTPTRGALLAERSFARRLVLSTVSDLRGLRRPWRVVGSGLLAAAVALGLVVGNLEPLPGDQVRS